MKNPRDGHEGSRFNKVTAKGAPRTKERLGVKQTGILFLHLGEFIFVADDEDPVERVWADEKTAVAELAREGLCGVPGDTHSLVAYFIRNIVSAKMRRKEKTGDFSLDALRIGTSCQGVAGER